MQKKYGLMVGPITNVTENVLSSSKPKRIGGLQKSEGSG